MSVTIENLTDRPVLLQYVSGASVYLGPRDKLEGVVEVELKDNQRIQRLKDRHIIAVHAAKQSRSKKKK